MDIKFKNPKDSNDGDFVAAIHPHWDGSEWARVCLDMVVHVETDANETRLWVTGFDEPLRYPGGDGEVLLIDFDMADSFVRRMDGDGQARALSMWFNMLMQTEAKKRVAAWLDRERARWNRVNA